MRLHKGLRGAVGPSDVRAKDTTDASYPSLLIRVTAWNKVVWRRAWFNKQGHVSCVNGCCDLCCRSRGITAIEFDTMEERTMIAMAGERIDDEVRPHR